MAKKRKGSPPKAKKEWRLVVQKEFREDLRWWIQQDAKVTLRILDLVEAITRESFSGPGKPEPLRYLPGNPWSRRITQEHRLIYRIYE